MASKLLEYVPEYLQHLCTTYLNFDSSVEIVGYITVRADTGLKNHLFINETVEKEQDNMFRFHSSSFVERTALQRQELVNGERNMLPSTSKLPEEMNDGPEVNMGQDVSTMTSEKRDVCLKVARELWSMETLMRPIFVSFNEAEIAYQRPYGAINLLHVVGNQKGKSGRDARNSMPVAWYERAKYGIVPPYHRKKGCGYKTNKICTCKPKNTCRPDDIHLGVANVPNEDNFDRFRQVLKRDRSRSPLSVNCDQNDPRCLRMQTHKIYSSDQIDQRDHIIFPRDSMHHFDPRGSHNKHDPPRDILFPRDSIHHNLDPRGSHNQHGGNQRDPRTRWNYVDRQINPGCLYEEDRQPSEFCRRKFSEEESLIPHPPRGQSQYVNRYRRRYFEINRSPLRLGRRQLVGEDKELVNPKRLKWYDPEGTKNDKEQDIARQIRLIRNEVAVATFFEKGDPTTPSQETISSSSSKAGPSSEGENPKLFSSDTSVNGKANIPNQEGTSKLNINTEASSKWEDPELHAQEASSKTEDPELHVTDAPSKEGDTELYIITVAPGNKYPERNVREASSKEEDPELHMSEASVPDENPKLHVQEESRDWEYPEYQTSDHRLVIDLT